MMQEVADTSAGRPTSARSRSARTRRKPAASPRTPLVLSSDASKSLSARFASLFAQARARELERPSADYSDTLLRHLVEVRLRETVPADKLRILRNEAVCETKATEAAVAAEAQNSGKDADDAPALEAVRPDFAINSFVFYCAARASRFEAVIEACRAETAAGHSPIVITPASSRRALLALAAEVGIVHKLEIWDFEQWLASTLYVRHPTGAEARSEALRGLVRASNVLAAEDKSGNSLWIDFCA